MHESSALHARAGMQRASGASVYFEDSMGVLTTLCPRSMQNCTSRMRGASLVQPTSPSFSLSTSTADGRGAGKLIATCCGTTKCYGGETLENLGQTWERAGQQKQPNVRHSTVL